MNRGNGIGCGGSLRDGDGVPAVKVKLGGIITVSGKLSVWLKVEALTVSAKL